MQRTRTTWWGRLLEEKAVWRYSEQIDDHGLPIPCSKIRKWWMKQTQWPRFLFWYVRGEIQQWLLDRKCRKAGHAWQDHSVAGPESGDIHLICQRCGETYYAPLY